MSNEVIWSKGGCIEMRMEVVEWKLVWMLSALLLEADLLWLGQMSNGCLLYSYMEADAFMLHQTILCSVLLSPNLGPKCSFKHILHIFLIGNLFCLCQLTPSWPTLLQKQLFGLRWFLFEFPWSIFVSQIVPICKGVSRCAPRSSPLLSYSSFWGSALQHCEHADMLICWYADMLICWYAVQ